VGDIEASAYELFHVDDVDGSTSSPLIDWVWYTAKRHVRGAEEGRLAGSVQPDA
jgi:hypothetical protein